MASTASKGRKKTPAKTGRGGAKGGKQKKLNYDERTNDSRDASVSDSEVSSNGKWRHVPRVNSLITKKIGSCGCLILEESTSRDK